MKTIDLEEPEKPVAPEPAHSKPAEVVTLKTKAKTPSGGDGLGELNEVWSVIVDGGKTRVHRATETEIAGQKRWISETLTVIDFRNAYANRSVRVGKSEVDLGKWWINHPNRRQYLGGLVLWPGADKVPDDKLNLWRGWGVEPRKGDWSLMRQHIAEVIASGDAEHKEYVLNFLAFAVQYPDHQAEAALVLIGGKGCGKGVLVDRL